MPFRTKARNLVTNDILLVIGISVLLLISIQAGHAKVIKTQQQALQEAFPNSDSIDRKTLFLTEKQVNQIQKLAKAKLESKIVTFYVGKKADSLMGYAFSKAISFGPSRRHLWLF